MQIIRIKVIAQFIGPSLEVLRNSVGNPRILGQGGSLVHAVCSWDHPGNPRIIGRGGGGVLWEGIPGYLDRG